MEKKNSQFDLESNRKVYFSLGLFIVGALTTMAFTYKTPVYLSEKKVITQEVDIPILLVEKEIEQPIIEPKIPDVKPLSKERSTTPIFNDDLLNNIVKTPSDDKDPKIVLTKTTLDIPPIDFDPDSGNDIPAPEVPLVEFPDKEAAFVGVWTEYLLKNLKYPTISRELNEQGDVYLRFVVELDGSVTDVEVINKHISKDLQKEAIRVVKSSPKWEPGIVNGEYVRSVRNLRIKFKLR